MMHGGEEVEDHRHMGDAYDGATHVDAWVAAVALAVHSEVVVVVDGNTALGTKMVGHQDTVAVADNRHGGLGSFR
jgi:hypothetical protein